MRPIYVFDMFKEGSADMATGTVKVVQLERALWIYTARLQIGSITLSTSAVSIACTGSAPMMGSA